MSPRYRNLLKENNPVLYEKMCLEIGGKKSFVSGKALVPLKLVVRALDMITMKNE